MSKYDLLMNLVHSINKICQLRSHHIFTHFFFSLKERKIIKRKNELENEQINHILIFMRPMSRQGLAILIKLKAHFTINFRLHYIV